MHNQSYEFIFISRKPLISCLETQLLGLHLTNILQKGFDNLMDENRISDLALMYQLFSRVKRGLDELCAYFGAYIKVTIELINNETSIFFDVLFILHTYQPFICNGNNDNYYSSVYTRKFKRHIRCLFHVVPVLKNSIVYRNCPNNCQAL